MLYLSKIYMSDYMETHYELTDDASRASSVFIFKDFNKIVRAGLVGNVTKINGKFMLPENIEIQDVGIRTSEIKARAIKNTIESNVNPIVEVKGLAVDDDKLHIIKCKDGNYYIGCRRIGLKIARDNFFTISNSSLMNILAELELSEYHDVDTFGVSDELLVDTCKEYEILQEVLREVCYGINDNLSSDVIVDTILEVDRDTFRPVEAVYYDKNKTVVMVKDMYGEGTRYFTVSNMDMICVYASCDGVIDSTNNKDSYIFALGEYPRIGYNELMLWIGNFKYILEDKWLKYKYIMYNKKYFDNILSNRAIVFKTGYNGGEDNDSDNLMGYKQDGTYDMALFINGKYMDITSGIMSLQLKCTLLHEMCHAAVNVKYGDSVEAEGEDAATLGYIRKPVLKYLKKINNYDQVYCHGKKFFTIVNEVSKKANLNAGDIFGYENEVELIGVRYKSNKSIDDASYKRKIIKFSVDDVIKYIVENIDKYNELVKQDGVVLGAAKNGGSGIILVTSTVMHKRYKVEKFNWHNIRILGLRGDESNHYKVCGIIDTYNYNEVHRIANSIIKYIIKDV